MPARLPPTPPRARSETCWHECCRVAESPSLANGSELHAHDREEAPERAAEASGRMPPSHSTNNWAAARWSKNGPHRTVGALGTTSPAPPGPADNKTSKTVPDKSRW